MLKSTGHVLVKQYPVLPKYNFFFLFLVVCCCCFGCGSTNYQISCQSVNNSLAIHYLFQKLNCIDESST